jgi:proteasome lid subunit RPN8/RPN11
VIPVLRLSIDHQAAMVAHGRAEWPKEACGLLLGRGDHQAILVEALRPSANLSSEPQRQFEIDSALYLETQRQLRGSGQSVIGIYHSHPNGTAAPSAADLAQAWTTNFVWLILGITPEHEPIAAAFWRGATQEFQPMGLTIEE